MNEESGKSNSKKTGLMVGIVVLVSALLAWSLISLYKTPAYAPEEELAEEELGEEEETPATETATPAPTEGSTETSAPKTEEKSQK